MKAILLAAGVGTRLGGLAKHIPKPMMEVKGQKILEHNLIWLSKFGIKDIYINLHHCGDVIKDYFGEGKKFGVKMAYSFEEELLGTAGGVRKILTDFGAFGGEDFLVVYADNYFPFSYNLGDFIAFHRWKKSVISLGLYKNDHEIEKSGVALLRQDGQIIEFVEKPEEIKRKELFKKTEYASGQEEKGLAVSLYINAGLFILKNKFTGRIPHGKSDFGKDVMPSFLADFPNEIFGFVFPTGLIAIDKPELFERAQRMGA